MVLTAGAIAALLGITAALGAGAGLTSGLSNRAHSNQYNQMKQQFMDMGYSSTDAEYMASKYDKGAFNLFDSNTWFNNGFDYNAMEADKAEYEKIKDKLGDMPVAPDLDALNKQANDTIDQENAKVLALYDQMLGRSQDAYQTEIDTNNQAYNDYRNQVLTNAAQQQNMLQGGIRSEMDRQQRVAITRGASAAQRLVANINAQMGMQNKAAQQALDTSNNLAQSLLQQRQAAAGIRSNYTNTLNQDTSRRADLINGSAERRLSYQSGLRNDAYQAYNEKLNQWNDRINAYGDNPYVQAYARKQRLAGI